MMGATDICIYLVYDNDIIINKSNNWNKNDGYLFGM